MSKLIWSFFILLVFNLNAQENTLPKPKKHSFNQIDITVPLETNPYYDPFEKGSTFFTPNGLSVNFGHGISFNKTIGISINAGLDWKGINKLVVAPIYTSLIFTPKIGKDVRLHLQTGYGKAFAIGRSSLNGEFKNYKIGLLFNNDFSLHIDARLYNFYLNPEYKVGSISLGASIIMF